MTTIAYDGTSVAVDSRVSRGGLPMKGNKAHRLKDGSMLFACGNLNDALRVVRWFNETGGKGAPVELTDTDDFSAIFVRKGKVYRMSAGVELIPVPGKFDAIGSGRDFAIAALDLGYDAEFALKLAAKWDIYTGGSIRVFRVKP